IKLADFGIAKINDAALPERKITATNQVLGTAHYLAPEQLTQRDEVDHRVDIYALGVILYELLTGQLPIGNFEVPSRINSKVSVEVDGVLLRALQQRPTARFQSVDDFRVALQNCSVLMAPAAQSQLTDENAAPIAAVPFYCDGFNGLSIVHGTLRAVEDGIHIEYRSRDKLIGQIRSKLREATLPWNRLVRIDFRPGVFDGVMQVNGDSFSLLEYFPGSENGCLLLKIKHGNQELAQQVIQRILATRPHLVGASSRQIQFPGPLILAIPVLCILFGLLNIGVLAIIETAIATSNLDGQQKAMAIILSAICIGPIAIAQLVLGIIYANTGEKLIGQVAALVSMLPLSPVALASIPFGIWVRAQLQPAQPGGLVSPSRFGGWGLTTVFFSTESKYVRVASIIETAVCSIVICGVVVWVLGLYPTTLRYRIVGQASEQEISQFLSARLQDVSTMSIRQLGDRLEVTTLRRWRERVTDQLAITEAPSLVICADESQGGAGGTADNYVPSVSGKLPKGLVVRSTATGSEVACLSATPLHEDWLSAVQSLDEDEDGDGDSLTITWSREGFSMIREMLNDRQTKPIMALKVDGWIEAITPESSKATAATATADDDDRAKSVSFRWLPSTKRSIRSLQAALRGPSLSAELELME
ncbi:MAG: protein kinase, partial [Pirellulaceae bacterium]|nr:protein kinase [Pirellulaceae bacterium]